MNRLRRRYGHFRSRLSASLDRALHEIHDAERYTERAHKLAPLGAARAIIAGLHSDLLNAGAEFRKHIAEVKRIAP